MHKYQSSAAVGALADPKKNSRNGKKEEVYFNFTLLYNRKLLLLYRPPKLSSLYRAMNIMWLKVNDM